MNTEKSTPATVATATEFDWDANGMEHRTLTCAHHTDLRWITKHFWDRSLHYVSDTPECPCPPALLVVLAPENDSAEWN